MVKKGSVVRIDPDLFQLEYGYYPQQQYLAPFVVKRMYWTKEGGTMVDLQRDKTIITHVPRTIIMETGEKRSLVDKLIDLFVKPVKKPQK